MQIRNVLPKQLEISSRASMYVDFPCLFARFLLFDFGVR